MKIKVQITRQQNAEYFNTKVGAIVEVEFEQYVAAVVASQLASGGLEACKAQAVAARTFAVSRGVLSGKPISDSSSTAQAYKAKRYNQKSYPTPCKAARETAGQVLYYNNKPISAVYSHSNGGRTVSAQQQWGGSRAYLIAQDDPWDKAAGYGKNGHGVGMSQCGARWAGAHGISYKQILSFYYPNTQLRFNYGETQKQTIIIKEWKLMLIENQLKDIYNTLKSKEEKTL